MNMNKTTNIEREQFNRIVALIADVAGVSPSEVQSDLMGPGICLKAHVVLPDGCVVLSKQDAEWVHGALKDLRGNLAEAVRLADALIQRLETSDPGLQDVEVFRVEAPRCRRQSSWNPSGATDPAPSTT